MKKYYIFIIIIILVIPIQSYSADSTYTQVKLQLKWKHQFQFAGYYAAIEKGYYKELGIEVELVEANTTELPIDALINGNAQFATSTSDIILLRAAGKPVVLLATIFQHSAQILLVSETSKIEYVHNLSGKRLIIEPHAADIIAYMKDEGVPLNKVIQLPHSFDINMLVENKADAMTAYLTDEPFLLQQKSFAYKIFTPISGNIDFYGDVLITSEQLLKDNPKLALDFRIASLKGWEYAMKNSDEIIELIYNKYSKRHSKEHLAFEAEQMRKLILPDVVPIGYSNHRRWEKTVKIYKETGLLGDNVSITGLFYTDYINKLNIPWNMFIPLGLLFLFLSTIAFFFYRYTQKLKAQINQNKHISNTLVETEKQYQTYFDQSMLGMATTSLEKGWLEVNDVICNMFGYTREEFFKLTWDKMTYPDDLEKDLSQFKRVQEGEIDSYSMDKRFFRKNGDIFYSALTVNAVHKTDGSIDYMIAILSDITEQKETEKALRDSEMRWQFAVDGSELGLWDWDIPNNKVFLSKQWKKMIGYDDHEIGDTSEEWSKRIHPDDKEKVFGDVQKHTDGKVPVYTNEHRLRCKDGSYKWVLSKGISITTTDDGKPKRMLGTHADISVRKEAEAERISAQKKYEDLSNLLPVAVYEVDLTGKFLYVNNKAFEYFGYTDEIYNDNFNVLQMVVPEDRDRAKETIQEIIVKRIYKNNEYTGIRKDGSTFPILIFSNLILKDNKPVGIRGVVVDLTERKKTEEALKESEEKFRSFIDKNKAIILALDPSTKKILVANKAAVDFYGYSKAELINKSMTEINVLPAAEMEKIVGNAINHKVDVFYFKHKLANNEIRDIEGYPSPVKVGDKIHLLVIIFDVTERKKAEKALKNSEAQLKEINITKDKFFSIIAHDLKSPFNAILGFSEILLNTHKEYDDEKREEMINIVNSSAVRAFELLENLLTWSRSQSGGIQYSPEKLHLKILLIETIYNQEGQANKKNIKIIETINEEELIFVDKNMIETVLRNLISNAIKFTQKNGKIVILSKRQPNSNFLEISVTDTGVGISKGKIDNLFRIDKNTSTKGTAKETGTGLGLILCKEFVEQHNGKIWVESEEGKGSRFTFSIPSI